jgi:5-methylcytosine-specific restriction endonuclease McrA
MTRKRKIFTASERKLIWETYGNICYLCNCAIYADWHIDHVHPWSKGGSDELANLRPTHPWCNETKSDFIFDEQTEPAPKKSKMPISKNAKHQEIINELPIDLKKKWRGMPIVIR